ncbi:hypothetical protein BYT27DRAFT_7113139 [Phlegmacium glaucopus]|nr:hypothetical protein BYT27DRAFT_7113139 [Phlegmacium glaucopus]
MEEGPSNLLSSAGFNVCNAQLQATALTTTRKAVGLPSDVAFHRSVDHSFAQDLDAFSERVLLVTNKLLNLVATVDQSSSSQGVAVRRKGKGKLTSQDDVVDNFHSLVVDSMDQLLEKTDICLDDFLGKNKPPAVAINPPITSTSGAKKVMYFSQNPTQKSSVTKGQLEPVVHHAVHLPKPQLSFKKKADNSDSPWYPTLTHKYNAQVPLGYVYHDSGADIDEDLVANHPYRYETTHLAYPPRMFVPRTPDLPPSLEDTQATWVATTDAFQSMLSKLRKATEIAVDLEHHSYRSYSGFLCLMQISDREEDWVVDLLAVRDEVELLNEVFTDPGIVKVLHGADSDIVWLQQDFNVYIVNLFDTFHASKLLEFPRHGLANLLEMYCDFIPDKRYQLADWRIRPLPGDMLNYARSDTHFLLYIYDNLRNALLDRSQTASQSLSSLQTSPLERGLLGQALARSAETSLRVYTKEPYDALGGSGQGGWDKLAKKWNKIALTAGGPGVGVGAMQREVYRCVHGWREKVAREEDESTKYVLQNHVLFHIAEQPPAEMASLLGMFQTSVPAVVKRRAKELLNVIREAVKQGLGFVKEPGSIQSFGDDQEEGVASMSEEPKKAVVMLETEMKSLEMVDESGGANLWGSGTSRVALSNSHSSLFGPSQSLWPSASGSTPLATSASTLFGEVNVSLSRNKASSASLRSLVSSEDKPHVNELVDKINRSFVMAPVVPQISLAARETPDEGMEVSSMEVEIPFIPASQRPAKVLEEEQDTIVVVGQARQKRKRIKSGAGDGVEAGSGSAGGKKKTKVKDGTEDREAFDFSVIPNILDDNPNIGDGNNKKKRDKKAKKGGVFYGDFPAPPKAHSELKSGNQSRTFK